CISNARPTDLLECSVISEAIPSRLLLISPTERTTETKLSLLSLRYSSPMACNSLDLTLPFNSSTRDSLLAASYRKVNARHVRTFRSYKVFGQVLLTEPAVAFRKG